MSVSEAIPGASRLRNQNEILIEKSDEAFKNKNQEITIFGIFFVLVLDNLNPVVAVGIRPPTAPKSQLPLRFYRLLPHKGGARARMRYKYFNYFIRYLKHRALNKIQTFEHFPK